MAIKVFKPTTNGRRNMSVTDYSELTKTAPEKSLLEPLKKNSGRNSYGRITVRHKGLDILGMPTGSSLHPKLIAAPAPIGHLADADRVVEGLLVHVGKHQYVLGLIILYDDRYKIVGTFFQIAPFDLALKMSYYDAVFRTNILDG